MLGSLSRRCKPLRLGSSEAVAAVDGYYLSGDPGCPGLGERHDPAGDVLGLAAPSERYGATFVFLDPFDSARGQAGALERLALGRPRRDGVDADARSASSSAQLLVRCSSAALLAPYWPMPGAGLCPNVLETLMIVPRVRSRCGSASSASRLGPRTLVRHSASAVSILVSPRGVGATEPALLTSTCS